MVERIMLLKLNSEAERAELAKSVRDALIALDGVDEVSVGLPADAASAKSWDVSVVMLFVSEASQAITMASQGFTDLMARIGPQTQVVKAWSFERLG
ncbi:MAG: hypothetical protein QM778_12740 [Myxococcales bacterium]